MLKTKPDKHAQPWIASARGDLLGVIAPPFFASALVILAPGLFLGFDQIPTWTWFVLILGIDVAHVYGTLFRTYLDPKTLHRDRYLLAGVPILAWITGMLLYSFSALTFWRVLAYLAIFHFIRQQYGFVRIYSRKEQGKTLHEKWNKTLDALAIYSATLYPLIYWHTHLPRKFNWFIDGEFITSSFSSARLHSIDGLFFVLYLLIQCLFFGREVSRLIRNPRSINIPKDLLILGTTVSWAVGIILVNGDLEFTLINVVSHGIPYFALVWFTQAKKPAKHAPPQYKSFLVRPVIFRPCTFIGIVGFCAYLEETLWDSLIWRDHPSLFSWSYALPLLQNTHLLTLVVPLLCVPQFSHYLLDGFIWKIRDPRLRGQLS